MKSVLFITAAIIASVACLPTDAAAQNYSLSPTDAPVVVEQLGAAQAFDPGVQAAGPQLSTQLWQGTSASRATALLSNAPYGSSDPIVRDLLRAVLLSGGVPPEAKSDTARTDYESARFQAVLGLTDKPTREAFLARNPDLAKTPLAQVDLALMDADAKRACEISDAVTEGRATPEWSRIRAVCHLLRDEGPAAELTRDLLRSGGYNDPTYFALFDALAGAKNPLPASSSETDPLLRFMRGRLQDGETKNIWRAYARTDLAGLNAAFAAIDVGTELTLDAAKADAGPTGTAKLLLLAQSGNMAAIDAFIDRAKTKGVSELEAIQPFLPLLSTTQAVDRAQVNLSRYTKLAARTGDIGALQQIFTALREGPLQPRIALAADAIGGGFRLGELGRDIDDRLQDGDARARRDAAIALALGAKVSDAAARAIGGQSLSDGRRADAGDLLLLQASAQSGAQAETALRAAAILDGSKLATADFASVLSALDTAGLSDFAGRLAALDYLDTLGQSTP